MSEWIVVRNWPKFQHYHDRQPVWIKLYTELPYRDEWCQLTLAQQGLLVNIWVLYALKNGQLSTSEVPRRVLQKLPRNSLVSLSDAGFIQLVASKPLALARAGARSREEEKERDTPPTPPQSGGVRKSSKKDLRKFTGCRWVRGSHGMTHIPDPLGTDQPPHDWPYGRPSRQEVEVALKAATPPTPTEAASPPEGA